MGGTRFGPRTGTARQPWRLGQIGVLVALCGLALESGATAQQIWDWGVIGQQKSGVIVLVNKCDAARTITLSFAGLAGELVSVGDVAGDWTDPEGGGDRIFDARVPANGARTLNLVVKGLSGPRECRSRRRMSWTGA